MIKKKASWSGIKRRLIRIQEMLKLPAESVSAILISVLSEKYVENIYKLGKQIYLHKSNGIH